MTMNLAPILGIVMCGIVCTFLALIFTRKKLNNSLLAANELNKKLNQNLQTSEKRLSEANLLAAIAKRSILIAHDISNPLAVLEGYTKILLQAIESTNCAENIKRPTRSIRKATKNISSLVHNLKLIMKIQFFEIPTEVQVEDVITAQLEFFDNLIIKNRVKVVFNNFAEDQMIDSLEGFLDSIILNLVQNSIHAMYNTENPCLAISLERAEKNIQITISDCGPGIPPEQKDDLWTRFGSHENTGINMGYGLYSVKQAVDRLNGTITCDSSNDGTHFQIVLPMSQPESID